MILSKVLVGSGLGGVSVSKNTWLCRIEYESLENQSPLIPSRPPHFSALEPTFNESSTRAG